MKKKHNITINCTSKSTVISCISNITAKDPCSFASRHSTSYGHSSVTKKNLPVRSFSSTTSRSFSATPPRRADPISTTILSFVNPCNLLASDPIAGGFIVLIGMVTSLFFVSQSFLGINVQDFGVILPRLELIFLLYERFITLEQEVNDWLFLNANNFTFEILIQYYHLLQQLITLQETLFHNLSIMASVPGIELLPEPTVIRINDILEDLRLQGNNLVATLRAVEDELHIPEGERVPPF
jgi:hypothetical protein